MQNEHLSHLTLHARVATFISLHQEILDFYPVAVRNDVAIGFAIRLPSFILLTMAFHNNIVREEIKTVFPQISEETLSAFGVACGRPFT